MEVVQIVDGLISMIKKNLIAKTMLTANVNVGDTVISVTNSFRFANQEEIILIDDGYNIPTSPHYEAFEYAVIKEVIDTRTIRLQTPALSAWLVSDNSFIQKTIGHSPLYENYVYYGDREVIPSDLMAITVEPVNISNEWMYIQGGLSDEYKIDIMIYGKDIDTEDGMKILNKYSDSVSNLLNDNIHIEINGFNAPILSNVAAGSNTVIVNDNAINRENFKLSNYLPISESQRYYDIQDNKHTEIDFMVTNISYSSGLMYITVDRNFFYSYVLTEYATFIKHGRYFWDTRVSSADFGTVQKGSAFLRAARLNWFGKEIEEHAFPWLEKGIGDPP